MDFLNTLLRLFLEFSPLIGGLFGFGTFLYNFNISNKKLKVYAPQRYAVLYNKITLLPDFDPELNKIVNTAHYSCNLIVDLCIVNSSTKNQTVHSIKLILEDSSEIDLNRYDVACYKCYESFKDVPIIIESNSSTLLKSSFKLEDRNYDDLPNSYVEIRYQDKVSNLKLEIFDVFEF